MSIFARVLLVLLLALILYTVHLTVYASSMAMFVTARHLGDGGDLLIDVFPHGGLSYGRTVDRVTACLRVATGATVVLAAALLWPWRRERQGSVREAALHGKDRNQDPEK